MFKRFLHGIAFGLGFGLAFVAIWTVWYSWVYPALFSEGWISTQSISSEIENSRGSTQVTRPPPISNAAKFLGSTGRYAGEFERTGTLSGGDGIIAGKVTTNEGAVQGLSVRLALNGSVMSQWATTDSNGVYRISVPTGDYRIDGFDIDYKSANSTLGGKIGSPKNPYQSERFSVSDRQPGEGLDLNFIDPIVKTGPFGEVSLAQDIVVTWEPYPGATSYSVQLYESKNKRDVSYKGALYSWSKRPKVHEPRLKINDHGIELKPEKYYFVEIIALDETEQSVSRTPSARGEKDFQTVR